MVSNIISLLSVSAVMNPHYSSSEWTPPGDIDFFPLDSSIVAGFACHALMKEGRSCYRGVARQEVSSPFPFARVVVH